MILVAAVDEYVCLTVNLVEVEPERFKSCGIAKLFGKVILLKKLAVSLLLWCALNLVEHSNEPLCAALML